MKKTMLDKGVELSNLLNETPKQITIHIANNDLAKFKNSNFKLCFAKKVNDTYTVIWQAYNEYLSNNTFSWIPMYQIFATNTLKYGGKLPASTDVVDIKMGEKIVLDKNGILSSSVTGETKTAITLVNQYRDNIRPGINQATKDENGNSIFTPIYVAKDLIVIGEYTLTPKEEISVWFQQNVETSTMINPGGSTTYEANLTNTNTLSLSYENGEWKVI